MSEYKKCSNGHYYQGATCPYCRPGGRASSSSSTVSDGIDDNYGGGNATEAATNVGSSSSDFGNKTTFADGFGAKRTHYSAPGASGGGPSVSNQTEFFDESDTGGGSGVKIRGTRKLVGWLVTYSLDEMGVDFRLFEGKNIIGRDASCNITVNDGTVSDKHAVVLYRAGKFAINDMVSSHGTFVNDEDIELEPRYLKDGDIIRIGKTIFLFRIALFEPQK